LQRPPALWFYDFVEDRTHASADCMAPLVIAKLDRLARNVAFVSNLMEAGIEFVAVDFPHASGLTVHILAAMAEFRPSKSRGARKPL
jgi:hypothetical protein